MLFRSRASKDGRSYSISGRDRLQLWLDNDIIKTPPGDYAYNNKSLKYIIDDIIKRTVDQAKVDGVVLPEEIKDWLITDRVLMSNQSIKSVTTTTPQVGESLFSFISRVCSQHGLVIYCGVTGHILISRLATFDATDSGGIQIFVNDAPHGNAEAAAITDASGQQTIPIEESSYEESSTYHPLRIVQGQSSDFDWVNNGTADSPDMQWTKKKSLSHRKPDLDATWKGLAKVTGQMYNETTTTAWSTTQVKEMIRVSRILERRDTFTLRYVTHTFGGSSAKTIYDINRKATVTDRVFGIDKQQFLVSAVEMSWSRDGTRTSMDLCIIDDGVWPYVKVYEAVKASGQLMVTVPTPAHNFDPTSLAGVNEELEFTKQNLGTNRTGALSMARTIGR